MWAQRHGDMDVWKLNASVVTRYGGMELWSSGALDPRHGCVDMEAWKYGDIRVLERVEKA